jgi:hypothetical protein
MPEREAERQQYFGDEPPTNHQIFATITHVKELALAREEIILARLAAMDKAVALLEKYPTAIDVAVTALRELHQQKFDGLDSRLADLNLRLGEGEKYKEKATSLALTAGQELVKTQQLHTYATYCAR